MNKALVRTFSSVIMLAAGLGLILVGQYGIWILFSLIHFMGAKEMLRAQSRFSDRNTILISLVYTAVGIFASLFLSNAVFVLSISIGAAIFGLIHAFFIFSHGLALARHKWQLNVPFLVTIPVLLLLYFFEITQSDFLPALLLLLGLIWANDIFAYIVGSLAGKRNYVPKISPNKTVEGLIGGVAVAYFFYLLYIVYVPSNIFALAFGNSGYVGPIILIIAANFGDLIISGIKRTSDIKDMGSLIPGHGGIMDRFDSLFFALPYFILLNSYF